MPSHVLLDTKLDGLSLLRRGKVRDVYTAGDQLIMVATDRISAFDYVLGSGNHARTFLHLSPRNTLQQLPLGWYAEKGGYWAMSPGFDSRHPITRRLVSYECVFCHDGYPSIPAGHDTPGADFVNDPREVADAAVFLHTAAMADRLHELIRG